MKIIDALVRIFWIIIIPILFVAVSLLHFFIRRYKDNKRINKPFNLTATNIYKTYFPDEQIPEFNFIIVPKDHIRRYAHTTATFVTQILPSSVSDFQAVIVEDINDTKQIQESTYEVLKENVLPSQILCKLPIEWCEYFSWWLLKINPPSGYEKLILKKEPNVTSKNLLEKMTNSQSMKKYLEETYLSETLKEINFVQDVIFKLCYTKAEKHVFEEIGNNILKKNLLIIQIVLELKKELYQNMINEEKRQILAFNNRRTAFLIVKKLAKELKNIQFFYNDEKQFGTIFKISLVKQD